jgi:5'-methylthioadenosine/S-adenosylhomocysteine nucleosidase
VNPVLDSNSDLSNILNDLRIERTKAQHRLRLCLNLNLIKDISDGWCGLNDAEKYLIIDTLNRAYLEMLYDSITESINNERVDIRESFFKKIYPEIDLSLNLSIKFNKKALNNSDKCSIGNSNCILLISALYEEMEALETKLNEINNFVIKHSADRDCKLLSNQIDYNIIAVLLAIGATGNIISEEITEKFLNFYKPKLVILFGICAGFRRKSKLGDIIISNEVWDLRKCKIEENRFEFEPRSISSERKYSLPFKIKEIEKFVNDIYMQDIKINLDLIIGSSDNLIRSETYMNAIDKTHRKLGAIDMESAGIAGICSKYKTPFFIIKSISDFGDNKKDDTVHDLCCNIIADLLYHGFLS